ncbi:MAG: acetyl-CoA carboxylase biotin carboxylase subunit [Candidatus Abyssobacteria bacterium SURF_5]|uniref:Biotin carboxylase n=1 Tax=Abyssobacteria bacterium (strain SURF_5) TaxID=2093360 RepID=A0A3A4NB92_ABYX5|nr:MAG: acetyl-CoA carboxylase biotin carboxylase subunit [Candidatus Abyssubacteria bacterium SURF_5]
MFSKILIANRGEIALRIVRALKELGIKSVAVYSEADTTSLHVRHADESVCIGPPMSAKSYLNVEAVIGAAKRTGAQAIHPGYGYLAENGDFARACKEAGLVFIGPTPENLYLAGDKIKAKAAVNKAGVPIVPSSPDGVRSIDDAVAFASKIQYPVMVKASAGGGGRGIRICPDEDTLREEFAVARAEVKAAFGDDSLYIEKCLVDPRHIEFQVLADESGNVIHLGERECSIQRRYQKLIEEAPSPVMTPQLRQAMGQAAITAAKALNYFNAGTVEFLLDRDDNFYFMEVNARIQVEHPVTEMVTGIDLVKEQIRLADGGRLAYSFDDIPLNGWAIECRINAENPDFNFAPSPGIIKEYRPPAGSGIRLDTHLYQGYELPIYYDSLVAKLIAHDHTRDGAIRILKKALQEFTIQPIKTTIPLYLEIVDDPDFQKGDIHTGYIRKFVTDDDDDDEE